MSENQLITGDSDELLDKKNFPEINTKHSYKKIIIIISAILVAIAIAAVVIILIKRNKDEEKKDEGGKKDEEKYPSIEYNTFFIDYIVFQLFNFHLILYI
jgi:flagellar basal body-associated protein FliL